ncbi:MAG: biopolymer transporter ExbD [Methylophilus sp.]|nr:biopolymer transporter ExbD [Methylophilus sp.]
MSMLLSNQEDQVMSEINVTPLVDVMLVLLTVFIVTAPLLMNAVSVKLPQANAEIAKTEPKTLQLSISAQGEITLNTTPITITALSDELNMLKTSTDPAIEIYADEQAAYGTVAKVMAAIQRANITKFSFVMLPEAVSP